MTVNVDDLKSALGCETDTSLAERLGVERSTIAQWRRRAGVPKSWHYILTMQQVEAQSLAARRRVFGDGDGYYIHGAALALLDKNLFDWPMLSSSARALHIQEWILKASGYVIHVLGERTCNSLSEFEALLRELSQPEHEQGLKQWLFP